MNNSPVTSEPVAVMGGAIITLVTAVIVLLQAFDFDLTADQSTAIVGVATAIITVVSLLYARSQVVPTEKAEQVIQQAADMPAGSTPPTL